MSYIKKYVWYIVAAVLVLILFASAIHGCMNEPSVTTESQHEAETPQGVQQAAETTGVKIDDTQARTAAREIRYIYEHDTRPEYVVETTAEEAPRESEKARERSGADFAIVADKNNPDTKIDVKTLPKDTKVELNQYNVQAYKKVLHTIEIAPDIDNGGKGISEFGYTVSRKVTKDGQYLGIGASYNVDEHRTYFKVSYTW